MSCSMGNLQPPEKCDPGTQQRQQICDWPALQPQRRPHHVTACTLVTVKGGPSTWLGALQSHNKMQAHSRYTIVAGHIISRNICYHTTLTIGQSLKRFVIFPLRCLSRLMRLQGGLHSTHIIKNWLLGVHICISFRVIDITIDGTLVLKVRTPARAWNCARDP